MASQLHVRMASLAKGKGKKKSRSQHLSVSRPSLLRLLLVGLLLFLSLAIWRSSSSSDHDSFIRPEREQDVTDVLKTRFGAKSQQYAKDRDIWSELPEQQDMEVINPLYSIRVLRSILQHSNNTWQDQEGECQGYFIQSLLWLNIVRLRSKQAETTAHVHV